MADTAELRLGDKTAELEEIALEDDSFVQRKVYPKVDQR